MMGMPSRVTGIVALLLAGAVLAACGDSDGGSTTATTAPTASAATPTAAATEATAPAVLDDASAQTLCGTLFSAWQAGDDDQLAVLASPAAIEALTGHSAKGAGLRRDRAGLPAARDDEGDRVTTWLRSAA